jgi:hypothetical protein
MCQACIYSLPNRFHYWNQINSCSSNNLEDLAFTKSLLGSSVLYCPTLVLSSSTIDFYSISCQCIRDTRRISWRLPSMHDFCSIHANSGFRPKMPLIYILLKKKKNYRHFRDAADNTDPDGPTSQNRDETQSRTLPVEAKQSIPLAEAKTILGKAPRWPEPKYDIEFIIAINALKKG